ncbi:MAG: hypothetical protein AAF502_07850 [Bacteroidota bacterium]
MTASPYLLTPSALFIGFASIVDAFGFLAIVRFAHLLAEIP